MEHIKTFLKGMVIGIANVIPGVSGGTMAVIFGIYEKLTNAIGNVLTDKENRVKYISFLVIVAIGAGAGIVAFAKLFKFLLADEISAQATYIFFIGLIIGSIPFVAKLHSDMKISFSRIFSIFFAIALVYAASMLGSTNEIQSLPEVQSRLFGLFGISSFDFGLGIWLMFCGVLGGGSMILPGFSGSALLISLGEYHNIMHYIDNRMLYELGFFGAGVALGIIVFAKVVSFFLKKFPAATYYFIIGLLIASIFQIYNEIKDSLDLSILTVFISTAALLVGYFVSYQLSKVKK